MLPVRRSRTRAAEPAPLDAAQGRARRAPARPRRHADRRRRKRRRARSGTTLPPVTGVNAHPHAQAGRDGAADRAPTSAAGADGARLPALRPRQGDRDADPGFLALADGREDAGRRHDARELLAAAAALAGRRRARAGRRAHHDRSRRAGRAGQADGRSASTRAFVEVNDAASSRTSTRRRARPSKCRWSGPASATASTAARFVTSEPGAYEVDGRRRRATARSSAPASCTCASRPATPSTSTPRCSARRCSGSRRKPAAASSRRPTSRAARSVRYSGRGVTVVEERELWDMPIILLADRPGLRRMGLPPRRGTGVDAEGLPR